jgi:glycosyltransferase involved in cell wall biosynthesis
MHALMRSADAFVHPSQAAEGLPTVLLEAGAAGVAVIATPVGATAELLANGRGFLVPPGDEEALAEMIDRVLSGNAEATAAGSLLRSYVAEYHGWEVIAARANDLLRMSVSPSLH